MNHRTMPPEQPPTPNPIRLRERWRSTWHARRDARVARPGQQDAPPPYLAGLRADAEAGQRAVTAWLHDWVAPLDREAAQLLTLLEQFRRDPPSPPSRDDDSAADPQPDSQIPTWVLESRRVAAAQRAYERRIRERDDAEQTLGQLGATRRHLVDMARASARAHVSRYEQLAASYCAVLARRGRAAASYRPPAVRSEDWVDGDLPLLALEIDSELVERYRWVLRAFEVSASAPVDGATEVSQDGIPPARLSNGR